jgi:AcrR family transcriptional regulator
MLAQSGSYFVAMPSRRQPRQERAKQTVEAVLDAVARVVKRDGIDELTTNRIAQLAGVSIGSLYQYFPDKRAILLAVRDRHVEQMARLVERALVAGAEASLATRVRGLLDAIIDAHALDPALYEALLARLPPADHSSFERRLAGALRLAITASAHEFARSPNVERMLFVLPELFGSLAHAVVLRRPAKLSLRAAREEAACAVLAYLAAHGYQAARR